MRSRSENLMQGAAPRDAQLATQAAEALVLALASSADPVLRELHLAGIEPRRNGARLHARVYATDPALDESRIERALERAAGYLRNEVASAVTRKRVPELVLEVVRPPDILQG